MYVYMFTSKPMYGYVYTCVYMYIHMYTCTHMHIYTRIYICRVLMEVSSFHKRRPPSRAVGAYDASIPQWLHVPTSSKCSDLGKVPLIINRIPSCFEEHSLIKGFWKIWVAARGTGASSSFRGVGRSRVMV